MECCYVCWPWLTAKRVEPVVSISWVSCWTTDTKLESCCQRYIATCGKKYIGAHLVSALNYCSRFFFKTLSYLYEVVRTNFSADFLGIFAIFYRNFAKIVAAPSDLNENYVAHLKEQSLLKKDCKRRRNRAINGNAMLGLTMQPSNARCSELGAWPTNKQKNKQTPHFRTYSRRALCDLHQTLHGDRARRAHQKGVIHFLIQRIVFPTGCTEKFGLIYRRAVSPQ